MDLQLWEESERVKKSSPCDEEMPEIQSIFFCQGWQRLRLTHGFPLIVWGEAKLWSSFPLSCVIYWQKWWFIMFFLCLNPQRTAWQRWVTSCPFSLKFLAVQKNPVPWFYPLFIYLFIDVVVVFWATALAKYEFHQKLLSLKITFLICLNTLQPKKYNIFCQRALKLNMDVMNL